MLITIASFLVLLLILIFVHELGHFLAAKLLGVRVERFSLGFPPKLWSKKIGQTEYRICWLPLGGSVSLLAEQPGTTVAPEDIKYSFSHKPNWVKMIIVFAGPLFNIVFAVLALWVMSWVMGIQHVASTVGPLSPDSQAYEAGIRRGDIITEIDGKPIQFFDEISDALEKCQGRPMDIMVARGSSALTFKVTPALKEGLTLLGDPTSYYSLGLTPQTKPIIGQVLDGKPAQEAGLKEGDLVTAINGVPVEDWQDLVVLVQGPESQRALEAPPAPEPLLITVSREGQTLNFSATPVAEGRQDLKGKTLYTFMLGIAVRPDLIREPVGPIRAFGNGLKDTWATVELTYISLYKLIQNKISAKVMGGPIMIAEVAGRKIRDGLADFVSLMALISINLAIINLVPLPVLDGGQLLIFSIEAIRRRPLSMKLREITQMVGVTALLALMILVFYNDISRLVTRFSGPPAVQTQTVTE
ncbi:MAG: RIP metalloprotease RseP [Deltaproteobacteria bacterium]|jgi:regulator of sigma E protease|nr:RIP metalloprotease RseP [Deltaproteobacteria bacterium]